MPSKIREDLERITTDDFLAVRELALRLSRQKAPLTVGGVWRSLTTRAPRLAAFGSSAMAAGRAQFEATRQSLATPARLFVRRVVAEAAGALNDTATLIAQQDAFTKRNLSAVFSFAQQFYSLNKRVLKLARAEL